MNMMLLPPTDLLKEKAPTHIRESELQNNR